MGIGVLGPVVVEGAGSVSPRDRVLLSVLVVRRGEVVSADLLADVLWGDDVPESWRKVVQGSVVRLRKQLGPAAIETSPGGYRLVAGDDDVDAWQFEQLVRRAAELSETEEHDRAAELLTRAQALWRGEPLADLGRWPAGQAEAARLLELRRRAEENQVAARLALGEHRDVVARAAALAAEEPLREERWTLLATALYRAGRQGEALRCLNDARRNLSEQLGVGPGPELVALEQAILDQDRGLDAPMPAQVGPRAECPYQGLEAYDEAQAEEFFGRDVETAECRRRLADQGFLAIVGPSGSGKSSLVRAGLVAGLKAEGRASVVCMPGSDPTGALLAALAAATSQTVLVVDQGEELFTVCSDATRRQRFAAELAEQAEHRPVVITLRADHIGDLVAYPDLTRLVESGLYLLGPMSESDLRAAIEGPARDAGLRLEAGLVDLLVRDVLGQPGALPLLSHALVEIWARREGRVMTVDAYRESGGVQGAVARTAEQLYESLSDPQRHDARALFLRLVSVERDGQPVRHRLQRSMLARDQDEIAGTLVRARLLTAGDGSLEIAHEALADAWPRLQDWLDEDRDGQRVLTHLSASAQDWSTRGCDPDDLYRGPRLAAAHEWVTRTGFELSEVEASFLTASDAGRTAEAEALAARNRAQVDTNRRLRRRLRVGALLLAIALVATTVAVVKGRQADRDRSRAELASRNSALQNAVSQSLGLRSSKRDVAALLAAEAYRLHPGAPTQSAMLATVTGAPDFAGYLATGGGQLGTAALDADGGRLVVSDTTSNARIFDTASMRLVRVIKPPRPRFYGVVALSPAASVTVVASSRVKDALEGGAISAYDTRTGRARFPEVQLGFDPGDVVISPDGRWVAVSGGPKGMASVLDLRTGATVASIAPAPPGNGPNEVNTAALAFITSDRLAVGSEFGVIRIVDPATGVVRQTVPGAAGFSETRIFPTPDGRALVTSGAVGTTVIDLATGAARWPARLGVTCNRVAADFRLNLVLCADPFGRVQSFDLATGVEVPRRFDFQQGFVSSIAVSDDGSTLALAGGVKGAVGVWRLDGSGPVQHKIGSGIDSAIEYDPAGRALLVARSTAEPWSYRVVDPETGRTIDPLDGVVNASWSGRRNIIGVVHQDGTGALYDVSTHRQVRGTRIKLPFTPVRLIPDQARHRIILLDQQGHVQGVRGGKLVAPHLDVGRSPNAAGITPNGRYLLVASDSHGTETYDLASGRRASVAPALSELTISSHGIVAAARLDGHIGLYDPRTLQPRGSMPAVAGGVVAMQFSADGRRLALEGWDGAVRLIDVASRRELGDPIPIANRDVYVGTAQLPLRPDGRQVAVDLADGIATWDVSPEQLVRAACTVAGRNLTHTEWHHYLNRLGPYHRTCPVRA